ncbi:ribosomal protein S14 [Culex quinquefasciatus]|uniref:Ribosomal protein S14 n=1 Tax=Culex quinquefasciatus TaxID=7176 RepID=B0XEG5_CULQU|nr:ribosomal protein S14 [Culex quinquefasciatus]|eukprot:XP_001868037.1 ribosomal protein S14 [Culex quinquefasciatus]
MAKTKYGKEEVQVLLYAQTVGPRGRDRFSKKLYCPSPAARNDEISLYAASLAAQGVAEKSLRVTARTPAEAACHRRKPLQDPSTGCLVGTLSPGRIEDVMPIPSDLPRRREVAAKESAEIFVVVFLVTLCMFPFTHSGNVINEE